MYFAFHKKTRPTGEVLASALQIPNGMSPSASIDRETLIRWGSQIDYQLDNQFGKVLNKSGALSKAADKFDSLFVMQEAGLNVPEINEDPIELISRVGYPILGRKFKHTRGTDIKLILQQSDLRDSSEYYIQYIPTVREFRIHVVADKIIRIQGKYLDFPEQKVSHIRNYETGYRFRTPNRKIKQDRIDAAKLAVNSLGLDFGAVDLIVGEDGLCYPLEVNTAPSCSPLTARKYVNAFANILGIGNLDYDALTQLAQIDEQGDTNDE